MNPRETKIFSLTKDLSQRFIEKHYAEEAPYFSLIWDEFLRSEQENGQAQEQVKLLTNFTLHFDKNRIALFSPLIIATIQAVLSELDQFEHLPGLTQFQNAITGSAIAFGADGPAAIKLSKTLAPHLLALLQNPELLQPAKKDLPMAESDEAIEGYVYADWLFNDEHKAAQLILKSEKAAQIANKVPECDFAVDETEGKIRVWVKGTEQLQKVPDEIVGMLWLTMTHIDRRIELVKIRDLFGLRLLMKGEVKGKDPIYGPRNRLIRFFGERWNDKIMVGSKDNRERYFVSDNGWSFYWFRRNKNPKFSELVYTYKKKGHLDGINLLHYEQAMLAHQSFSGKPRESQ